MASKFDETKQLKCSFCGKGQEQVRRLIAGPNAYICDECIELCSEIIEEELEELLNSGIKVNTVRLSIGTENIDDIIEDLDEAFKAVL